MQVNTFKKIEDFFEKNPIAKGIRSTENEIKHAENELNIQFDKDYIFFQLKYGGSLIKAGEIYGFHNSELMEDTDIVELTKSYRQNENGFIDWLIIGTDYSGNSIGINKDGNVLVYDHDFKELKILANSFEEYILKLFEN
ncbi:1,3-beta-glucan synthase regulator [Cellulophaga lytica]|uniref:SMI1/KNR4 family protein n=1 Tax=Cellulophaga lytica TaxID=979 RepID=UPI00095084BF|nr:SMI1/KNR4 family protein [Cellulophaga lytica]APU09438.1 1,3-beta-glucan synthase regulator [Cellulophaga lytica]